MNPINYVQQLNDPTSSVMAGYQRGLQNQAATQGMDIQRQQMEIQQAQEGRAAEMQPYALEGAQLGLDGQRLSNQATQQQIAAQQAQQVRAQQFQTDMANLASLGADATLEDFAQMQTQYPEMPQAVMATFKALDDERQASVTSIMAQGLFALKNGDQDTAVQLLEQYAEAAEAEGDAAGAVSARSLLEVAKVNPEAALASGGIALYSINPDIAGRIFDAGSSVKVQSSQSVGPTLSVQTMSDGTTRVVDTATNQVLEGDAARQAIEAARAGEVENQRQINAAREEGKDEGQLTSGSEVAANEALGKLQATFVEDALSSSSQVMSGMNTIREAIAALDAGGRSGAFDRLLPNVTEASASLSNAMDRMGLDVIGSVTFGALSEGELRLAMETAVPRNLDQPELRSWLERKLDAQRKVRAALIEQAQFLSDPRNSLNDWTMMVGGGQPTPQATSQPGAQPAAPAGNQPSFMQFSGGN